MKWLRAVTLLFYVAAVTGTFAADWPPVSKEELAMADDPVNPGAPAIILYRDVNSDDVKGIETQYRRIKVLNDEGRKYADIEIPYVDKLARITDIQARTTRPDGTEVNFQGEILDRVAVKARKIRIQVKALTLPDVQKGSILEYSYTTHFPNQIPDFMKHPDRYIFKRAIAVPSAMWELREELFTRQARFSVHRFPGVPFKWVVSNVPQGARPREVGNDTTALDLNNLSPFLEEEHMPPEHEMRGWVGFYYLLRFSLAARTYWQDAGAVMAEQIAPFLSEPMKLRSAVASIISLSDPPEIQLRKLYARVQQIRSLKYEPDKTEQQVKREGLKENKNVEDVLKHGYAYTNEINLALVALARAAGFESVPIRVTGRDKRFFSEPLEEPSQLNAMVVWVRAGGKDYYLDPATPYCPFNLLPWAETATMGIAVTEGRSPVPAKPAAGGSEQFATTPDVTSATAVLERSAVLQLEPDGSVQGTVDISFTGQGALERRIATRNMDEAARKKSLEEEVKGWLPAVAQVQLASSANWDEADQPLRVSLKLKIPDYATATGRRLFLRAGLWESSAKAFRSQKRVNAIYFAYPFQEADDIVWKLPPGCRVDSLPEKQNMPTIFGIYSLTVSGVDGTIHASRHFTIEAVLVPVQYYNALRSFFNSARLGDESQIALENAVAQDAAKIN